MPNVTRLKVIDDVPDSLLEKLPDTLKMNVFVPLDNQEVVCGWCGYNDALSDTWTPDEVWACGADRLRWGFRVDTKRVPASLLKKEVQAAIRKELRDTGKMFMLKERKEEIKTQVKLRLIAKALPVPEAFKVVWDATTGYMYINTTSEKKIDLFTSFVKDKLGLTVQVFTPYDFARSVFENDEAKLAQLQETDFTGKNVTIPDTQFLYPDFLTWLWCRGDKLPHFDLGLDMGIITISVEQNVTVEGGCGEARDTTTVSGSLSPLIEARNGLVNGKKVTKEMLRIETQDASYGVTLRAKDSGFFSLKLPKIPKPEKGEEVDEAGEFLLRFSMVTSLIEIVDTLYALFIKKHIDGTWEDTAEDIARWIETAKA